MCIVYQHLYTCKLGTYCNWFACFCLEHKFSYIVISSKLIVELDFFTCRFKFPSVFIIYQNITVVVYAIFILVGYTAKTPLFCNSDDVTENLDNPTPFCTIIGNNSLVPVNCLLKNKFIFLISLHLRVGFNFKVGRAYIHIVKSQSESHISLCYRYCFILHTSATSTMGSFSCGGGVLGHCVSDPHAAASCFREDQVHPHHDGTTRSHSTLCASCSYFWRWRICSQRHSLSSHHLSWERQGSFCLLSKHCWEHYNCHRNFPSDNRVSKVHQGKAFMA